MGDLRILIVDDEPLVRDDLRRLLSDESGCVLVGEARSGVEASRLIREAVPDIVFLDVQLPSGDAFEVLARLPLHERPTIVFVTAFAEHALRAFDLGAADYLLKPFNASRFRLALSRARAARASRPSEAAVAPTTAKASGVLLLRRAGRVHVVPIDEVSWVEAADNYVRIHARSGRYMMRTSLREALASLEPHGFVQAHRSALVSVAWVETLQPLPGGENRLRLLDGAQVTLSRAYRDGFREALRHARGARGD